MLKTFADYSFSFAARNLFYMQAGMYTLNKVAFVTPVVEHWLKEHNVEKLVYNTRDTNLSNSCPDSSKMYK